MPKSEYFTLTDLPSGEWAVGWPTYEHQVVTTPEKASHLLSILFDDLKLREAQLETVRNGQFSTLYIPVTTWYQDPDGTAKYTVEHTITACKFPTQQIAEAFLDILEKILVWQRLQRME